MKNRVSHGAYFNTNRTAFCVMLVLCAASMLYSIWLTIYQCILLSWSPVKAKVLHFDDGERKPEDGFHWYARPIISYEYTIGNQTHNSTGWNPSPFNYQGFQRKEWLQDTENICEDKEIICWYNPSKPEESYAINKGVTLGSYILIIVGLLGSTYYYSAKLTLPRLGKLAKMPAGLLKEARAWTSHKFAGCSRC